MPTKPFLKALLTRLPVGYALPALFVTAVVLASLGMPAPAPIGQTLAACTSSSISAAPPSPHQPSGTVVVTGTGTCTADAYGGSGTPTFRFWVQDATTMLWTIGQDYGLSNTFNWVIDGLVPGTYGLEVDVRSLGFTSVSYEQHSNTTYVIQPSAVCGSASGSSLSAAPPSPSATGTTVTFTASTTGCPNPRYRFWVQAPGGPWMIVQDYGPSNKFVWSPPATNHSGRFGIEVDFRDLSQTVSYDDHINTIYVLGCTAVGLTASPPSPAYPGPSGTSTVLTATSTCPGTPTYKFWVLPPGGVWTVLRDYGLSNTYNWLFSGLPVGTYQLEVDVRDLGSIDTWEQHASIPYVLRVLPCATAGLSAAPPSPGATGATITLTGSSTGCNTPVYRFWVQAPGGNWTIVQNYSTSPTFLWQSPSTGLAGIYGLEVDVRDIAESTTYDVVHNITYQLNGCSASGLAATPPTVVHGAGVLLTGSATCPGTPTYRFWAKAPGGNWAIVRDYNTTNTFTYTTTVAGIYGFEVDVRDQGATDTYEQHTNINSYTAT